MSTLIDQPFDGPFDGEDMTAAEYALGVLDAGERAAAEARAVRDLSFAGEIQAWQARLGALWVHVSPVQPSAGVWPRIEAGLPRNRAGAEDWSGDDANAGPGFWRVWAIAATGVAAAALLTLVIRPPRTIMPAPVQTAAAVTGHVLVANVSAVTGGQQVLTFAYDPVRGEMIVAPAKGLAVPQGRAAELWLIPADGSPRSLGLIDLAKGRTGPMSKAYRALVAEKGLIAVTFEQPGGSPTGKPSAAPVAAGAFIQV